MSHSSLRIAVASGKGGTGKTTVSVALAEAWGDPIQLLDCDVEEPNAALFLKPEIQSTEKVFLSLPEIDTDRCRGCGQCVKFCQFNALAVAGGKAMVFSELCHSCGGCARICPERAIREAPWSIGMIRKGLSGSIQWIEGCMDIGYTMAPWVIREVLQARDPALPLIIDSPPGTSCAMVTAVSSADYVLLVTEPTPFGLHDLILAVETIRGMNKNFAVIINRSGSGSDCVEKYCKQERIEIILRIPISRKVAEAYSVGSSLIKAEPSLLEPFRKILASLV
ncbi:MAG: ATP-binding protein [Planctomycetes bacterium]|nr:ATP-binding protein [Planctomycetota bacterium]